MSDIVNALDLTQISSFDGTEQFVMFNTQTGKRATIAAVKDYIEANIDFPDEHGTGLYGAKWDRLSNLLTRTRDAAEITTTTTNFCHKGSINENYNNPFDSIYPWSEIEVCNVSLTKYKQGYPKKDCITAVWGDPDFTYFGSDSIFVGRYRPEFWTRRIEASDGSVEFLVSQKERIGYKHVPEAFTPISFAVDDGSGNNTITGGAGIPLTNIAVSSIHARAKTSGFTLSDIDDLDAEIVLLLVEYANMNGQAAIGDGCSTCYREDATDVISSVTHGSTATSFTVTDSALSSVAYVGAHVGIGTSVGAVTYKGIIADVSVSGSTYTITLDRVLSGVTDGMIMSIHGFASCEFPYLGQSLGSASGYLGTNSKANAYYRGRVLWGNKYSYILGIYRQTGTNHLWTCPANIDPDDYDALNTSVHYDTGIVLPTDSAAWKTVGGNAQGVPNLNGFMATGTSSGNSSSPVGDQQYVPATSTGNTILLAGGRAGNGWTVGPFCGLWGIAAGDSYWTFAGLPLLK